MFCAYKNYRHYDDAVFFVCSLFVFSHSCKCRYEYSHFIFFISAVYDHIYPRRQSFTKPILNEELVNQIIQYVSKTTKREI